MRYYKYNLEYYYTGFEDSETELLSSTTIAPENQDDIVWNPTLQVWEHEVHQAQTLEEIKIEEIKNCHAFFDDLIDNVFNSLASFEPETFATQEEEWRAYQLDINAQTPYVDILCNRRNIDKAALMSKIGIKVMSFADAQGNMHALEDAIDNAPDIPTLEYIKANVLPWYQ